MESTFGKRTAYLGVFVSLAMIVSYVESLIPFYFGIPGIKLGLSNLVIILVLYRMKTADAFLVSIVRVVLSAVLFGNIYSLAYSLAGGILSLMVMTFVKKTDRFSIIGVSIWGGVFHNIGQILMAVLIVSEVAIASYLPVLLIAGTVTGFLIGMTAQMVLRRLRRLS